MWAHQEGAVRFSEDDDLVLGDGCEQEPEPTIVLWL
jgi:hypothetical protein